MHVSEGHAQFWLQVQALDQDKTCNTMPSIQALL